MKRPRRSAKRGVLLRPARPNVGLQVAYRRRLSILITTMQADVVARVTAAYAVNRPEIAQDATPAADLTQVVRELAARWEANFDDAAPKLADWFGTQVEMRSEAQLRSILKKGGFSVPLRQTPASRDVLKATVEQNVSLIRSISSEYFTEIEGLVMRSVQTGRDLGYLTQQLRSRYGVTERRAALIARDQNAKATSAMQKARQLELGVKQGIWMHSGGGKEPRKTHVANNGKPFNIAEGWFDPDPRVRARIMPGELINCRCVWRAVVPGFD